jgi:1,2-diacylglycerol 3-beta-galactosyltransferase
MSSILFLFSDTGGGHRASATAVASAIELEYPGRFEVELLDPFVDGSRPFLRWLVYRYQWMLKHLPLTYGLLFHATDNRPLTRTTLRMFGNQIRPALQRHLQKRSVRAIVSFHPLLNHITVEAMESANVDVPFITVITDMSDFHRFWMSPRADMIVVPSIEARSYCVDKGLDPRRVHIAGLPVDPRFSGPLHGAEKSALRKRLRLKDAPTVLLMSGGEGVGALGRQARALDRAGLGLQLIVVCGRNQRLYQRLSAEKWRGEVSIYGFVKNMPELMQVSDAIVTKAGPGTISEALISGLPIFMTSYVPGQEQGNVKFVLENRVGWYVRRTRKLVKLMRKVLGPGRVELERMRGRAEMVGRPGAAREIAQLVAAAVEPPAPTPD